MKLAAGMTVTRLVSDALWQCHVYINEMEMRVCLSALCNECLWGDLGISLKERGRYINRLSDTGTSLSPPFILCGMVVLALTLSSCFPAITKKKRSYLHALQCLQKFVGKDLQSCISEVQWYS